jgi:hypothetical protein
MDIPKMNYTGDFTMMQQNNPNMWTQSIGGGKSGSKRLEEIDIQSNPPKTQDTQYLAPEERNQLQSMLNKTMENQSYGTTVLNGMNARSNPTYNMANVNTGDSDSIRVQPKNLPTTPAIVPADLTTTDRMSASPEHEIGSMTNPNTLGDSLSTLVESVHDKTVDYETKSNAMINKDKGSAFDQAKDSMFSDYSELSGVKKNDNQKSDIERQIEGFVEVMNGSYEYYIYSSLLVDSGKSISQTAQTLTKG